MERYSRHYLLQEIGQEGQQRLREASVLIVGVGGLGSPISLYLAAAGVGRIGLIDDDEVSMSNLQRQILYQEDEVGEPKAIAAKERLGRLNSQVELVAHPFRLTAENAQSIIDHYDLVVDGCDNFDTRYLIDEVTARLVKPYVYGSIGEFGGQLSIFNTQGAGRYCDLFPREHAPTAASLPKGVMGAVPGVIGSLQATEVIKLITGAGTPLINQLLVVDLLAGSFRKMAL